LPLGQNLFLADSATIAGVKRLGAAWFVCGIAKWNDNRQNAKFPESNKTASNQAKARFEAVESSEIPKNIEHYLKKNDAPSGVVPNI
jgi:hypothetical protein